MGVVAFVYPGQGSQYVGMGKDLYEQNPLAKELFQKADDMLGISLSSICFNGPEEELRRTKNTQPAIFLHSVILTKLLRYRPAMVAGHSLGEYSALVCSGAISFEDGLKLVRLRGELMQRAGEEHPGTMAAIIGLEGYVIEDICREASMAGIVQPANFNSPGQVVVSGSIPGVRKSMELAKARGAKITKELVVSGAFHSQLMQSAGDGLRKTLATINIFDIEIPVYANVTAQPVKAAEEIRDLLYRQLLNPVRWEESIRSMVKNGATRFIEVGPGKVLQGLVKRISPAVEISGIDTFQEYQAAKG
ncbi:MAG: ACP S-malonyltransferase [Bacteroidota bacterium]